MQLFFETGNSRFVAPDHHENVLRIITEAHEVEDDLDMGHALDSGTHFILTLDDQYAIPLQHTLCLNSSSDIQFQYCVMPLIGKFGRPVAVRVMLPKRGMRPIPGEGIVGSV